MVLVVMMFIAGSHIPMKSIHELLLGLSGVLLQNIRLLMAHSFDSACRRAFWLCAWVLCALEV